MADPIQKSAPPVGVAVLDSPKPTMAQRGEKRMYHVGLSDDAPFEWITVPTVVLDGGVRGKCVQVPKKTAQVRMTGNGVLNHTEGMNSGAFEVLYDLEVEYFLKYVDTHVFRKTSDYEVPEAKDGKATGTMKKYWRAEIEAADPGAAGGIRSLHDEEATQKESIANYVWITPANVGRDGKPIQQGPQETISAMRKAGSFTVGSKKK